MSEEKGATGPREAEAWTVVKGKTGAMSLEKVTLPALKSQEIEMKVLCSGICASDLGAIQGVFPEAAYPYPIHPGHEGVGVVTAIGSEVTNLKVGDRVGLGVYRNACKACIACTTGKDNLCPKKLLTFMLNNVGTFSNYCRLNQNYAFKIPDAIPVQYAGPLMCAGLTTFAPFVEHDVRPGQKIGVVGVGGLGHLSIQFASKWGCEVTAISGSAHKEESCKSLGAHHFLNTKEEGALAKAANTFDFIMMTASGSNVDWAGLINALAPNGKLILMGISTHAPVPIPLLALTFGQKSICGSAAGSSGVANRMLAFAALHKIRPMIETFPFSEINDVCAKVAKGAVMYRAVCVHADTKLDEE